MTKLTASGCVEQTLLAVLPPGVPPSWRSIDAARFVGGGRRNEATADVTMFDGRPASVRVWLFAMGGHAHEWLELPGGHCSFEDGQWIRIDPATLEPVPAQASLFGVPA